MRYFGVVAQSLPRLMNLTPEELIESDEITAETELSIVRLNGQPAVIPDIEYIESCLAELNFD
jgi:hypothetical protein